ncbi:glycerol-3-phosphate 1-O-acyltransferase PlsY [Cellulosilyticum sp. I15G10I2]|uniref:glycerol-3-phosphate 1-O-acyltransferase PlsY n=1 Tax=Cellulosilyticum sp. I15G10I2 TaxID=1892843 RepID=UPI00085BB5F3|nr:glycerol-3-phosphate 1-O-acyltransferase PlsY [Cellulosilyticum sp. I15G10I2]
MYRIAAFIIGYLFGGIQSAILYGKIKGIDITKHGSGNPGTTNAARVLGKKAGIIVLLIDIFKAIFAVVLARILFPNEDLLIGLYSGIGAILGHSYPLFFKFKGGKGIATTAGMLLALDIKIFLIAGVLFLITFGFTQIVSISSLVLTASIPIILIIFHSGAPYGIEAMILGIVVTGITFYRHKANIKRLIEGTESKLIIKK